ncbi:MAG: acylphosphatase [Anaerolineales bacterium]|nr:acylphosphatase [Anaerolineales bacterium]
MEPKRIEATIYGRVQGVAFRHYTLLEANSLHVTGWVANRVNGTVRVVAEGPEAALKQLAAWLNHGPSAAYVERVDLNWMDGTGEFGRFEIR